MSGIKSTACCWLQRWIQARQMITRHRTPSTTTLGIGQPFNQYQSIIQHQTLAKGGIIQRSITTTSSNGRGTTVASHSSTPTAPAIPASTTRLLSSNMRSTAPSPTRSSFIQTTVEQFKLLKHQLRLPYPTRSTNTKTATRHRQQSLTESSNESKLVCLDVGDRYIGVAISQYENRLAQPLLTIHRRVDVKLPSQPISPHSHHHKFEKKHTDLRSRATGKVIDRPVETVHQEIRDLLATHQCIGLVVGMPMTLAGQMDHQCTKTLEFISHLQTYLRTQTSHLPVVPPIYWWDERLSSSDARQQLSARGVKGRQLAIQTDQFAAKTILQEFLDRLQAVL